MSEPSEHPGHAYLLARKDADAKRVAWSALSRSLANHWKIEEETDYYKLLVKRVDVSGEAYVDALDEMAYRLARLVSYGAARIRHEPDLEAQAVKVIAQTEKMAGGDA